jgi:TolB-like protein/class 3 adenylate cyclase
MSQTRQLAAIMFTDIVGYTALMGKDSAKALELVRISKEIQKPLVEKYHGQWLKEMGDGALAKFNTALDAVNCSIEIQEIARGKLDGKLRIGIHLGDITVENDDVYGDGVNVASRLESIADPGGIYISESIEKAIQGQTDVQAKYLGEVKLKNVAYGVRTYAVQGVGLPLPEVKADKELSGHLWAEVQRRGVIRAAVTYVAAGLLLVLLLRETQNWISLPDWSLTAILASLLVGFPIAMYLAWNYERSPEGFVRTSSRESWQNPLSPSQRKPFTGTFIIAGLVLVLAFMFFYPRFQSSGHESKTPESVLESRVMDKSIVVLPFTNISSDPEQEYFSDGMMEEILNHLVKIKDLKVISRTTAMQYKGTIKSLHEIAEELGVANVLEGSVRKVGNKIRITAQLIDGNTDMHLWSESYDRNLDDVFAIQSEVAQQVASALQAEIQPEIKLSIESQPTSSIEAYNLYLVALANWRSAGGESIEDGIVLLEKAISIDPQFATAYALMGFFKSNFSWAQLDYLDIATSEEALKIALPYYEKALDIDPENLLAHEYMGLSYLWYKWDFETAEREYRFVKERNPNYAWSDFLITSGRFEEAVKEIELNLKTDPLSPFSWGYKILSLYFNNQPEEALNVINTAFELNLGEGNNSHTMEASRVYLYVGVYDKVVETIQKYLNDLIAPRPRGTLAIAFYHLGEHDKANDLLDEIKAQSEKSSGGSPSFYVSMIYAQMGEIDMAFEWLEKAYQDHEVEMYWLKVEPPFKPLHNDPRWQQMLNKVGFPE